MMGSASNNENSVIVNAAILAGGRARRLGGIAKGNLALCNDGRKRTVMHHLLDELVGTFDVSNGGAAKQMHIVIVANDDAPYMQYETYHVGRVKVIADLADFCGVGPLAGIISALDYYSKLNDIDCKQSLQQRLGQRQALLILPCDLPAITRVEMQRLISAYQRSRAEVVFAATACDELHPLCAVVSCTMLPLLQQAVLAGARKICEVWREVGAEMVMFEEKTKFKNINTFADLDENFQL
jgi:molybdopterin-guanine dinucleotide biosynthesis protein A